MFYKYISYHHLFVLEAFKEYHFLTLMLFQTCMTFCLLWKTVFDYIMKLSGVQTTLDLIALYEKQIFFKIYLLLCFVWKAMRVIK